MQMDNGQWPEKWMRKCKENDYFLYMILHNKPSDLITIENENIIKIKKIRCVFQHIPIPSNQFCADGL